MRQGKGMAVDVRAVVRFLVRSTRRAVVTLVGFALVLVGLAGLVLPVLPGWVLIVGGFAVLSREYAWANSGLAFARRHAARGGTKLRAMAARRRARVVDIADPSGEVVIDLTSAQGTRDAASRQPERRASNYR